MMLYGGDLSPYVQRVKMQLAAKGLAYEYAGPPGGLKSEAYLAINAIGKVPCLVNGDGVAIPESEVIAEYLEEAFSKPALRPRKPIERAQVRIITRLSDIYLAPALSKCFPLINPPRDKAAVEAAIGEVNRALGYLEVHLSGKKHAVGNKLTMADCALAPLLFFIMRLTAVLGVKSILKPYKNLNKYWKSRAKDPICAQAMEEMSLAMQARFGI